MLRACRCVPALRTPPAAALSSTSALASASSTNESTGPTAFLPVAELQALGATAVTKDCLAQIKALNPSLKAVVEENRDALRDADAAAQKEGPLASIPSP